MLEHKYCVTWFPVAPNMPNCTGAACVHTNENWTSCLVVRLETYFGVTTLRDFALVHGRSQNQYKISNDQVVF